ncbi:terminase large subunit [Amycolatopsis sp. NPDC059657]|uniref:terminase large subunit n=1 Tax=Amycolatopsis sp. NPDC059657 TaxID=3346899 RepID=UPI00366A5E92
MAPPICGRVLDDIECTERGDHFCEPRARHAELFFSEVLVHTKGVWARKKFLLADWQAHEIIRPVFGPVRWSDEFDRYVRVIHIVWIELARKQGKSEILAGIALYMLCADGEDSAEIYGAACDRDQARKVFDVAARMVQLSPLLSKRLIIKKHEKRIVDEKTGSYYEVIAADAAGNLGHNPHCIVFDEVLTQKNGDLWDSLRTAMGTRSQAMMVAATTPGDDPSSWCGGMHDEMERVAEQPDRAPHTHVFLRNTPPDADPWDESGWKFANPALGEFLSWQALREEAQEARNDPAKENSFRQYRLAQWVRQKFRWMPMHLYDECAGDVWLKPDYHRSRLVGKPAWAGMDLAAKFDLTAWCVLVPEDRWVHAMWRFWLPEDALPELDKHNDGKFTRWAREGWITITEGNVVDYQRIYADVEKDANDFELVAADADQWSMAPVIQEVEARTGIWEIESYNNTYQSMTPGMDELMALVKQNLLMHHGNPVARSCFDQVEVRKAPYNPELIRPDKPERSKTGKRIDGVPAAAMACNAMLRSPLAETAPPESRKIVVSSRGRSA